jgi:hypothetical protein
MALETTSHRQINKATVSAGATAEPSRSGVRFAKLSLVGRGYSFRFAFAPVEHKWDSPADHDGSVAVVGNAFAMISDAREEGQEKGSLFRARLRSLATLARL